MPLFGLIARLLARLAILGAIGAMRRRAAGVPPPWQTPGTGAPRTPPVPPVPPVPPIEIERARGLLRAAAETSRIAVRVLLLTGFLAAFGVLLTAGTTATTLGPRWLGVVLLVLATVALVLGLLELRVIWRLRLVQVRRRRAERLRAGRS